MLPHQDSCLAFDCTGPTAFSDWFVLFLFSFNTFYCLLSLALMYHGETVTFRLYFGIQILIRTFYMSETRTDIVSTYY